MDETVSSPAAPDPSDDAAAVSLVVRARRVAAAAAGRAVVLDRDGAFPNDEIRDLSDNGLLLAPFPTEVGGDGLGIGDPDRLRNVLVALGQGSLSLGRLYEGHVNAVVLAVRYGTRANLSLLKEEALAGRPSGVWMAGEPLRLQRDERGTLVLRGGKVLCSGAGVFRRPLVAAEHDGGSIMAIPFVDRLERMESASWTTQGMRATATGSVDFDDIAIGDDELVGTAGDYLRSPYFRGGAWRVIAVQLGGLEAILQSYRDQLKASPHRDHPIQLARFGEAVIAFETARLWVTRAALTAEGPVDDPAAIDAYVDLARNAFEDAALRVMSRAQKAIGLKTFIRSNPLERLIRDLSTYLRQPALDASLASAAQFHLRSVP